MLPCLVEKSLTAAEEESKGTWWTLVPSIYRAALLSGVMTCNGNGANTFGTAPAAKLTQTMDDEGGVVL
jgi:hypothetical protein